MAGQAPEFSRPRRRLEHWFEEASDLQLSLYMLFGTALILISLYALDQCVFS